MADYPVLDANGNTVIAAPGSTDDHVGYPILDGFGNTIITAPGWAFRPGYPISNAAGQVLIPSPGWGDDKLGYPILDGAGNIIIPAPGYSLGTIPLKGDEEVVAKGGAVANALYTLTGSNTVVEGRVEIVIGRKKCNEIRVEFANGYITNGWQANSNAVEYGATIERVDGTPMKRQFRWNGVNLTQSCAGGAFIQSEAILSSLLGFSDGFPEGSKWRIRTWAKVGIGQKIPYATGGIVVDLAGENMGVVHDGATSQLDALGDLTVPAGGSLTSNIVCPSMIIGRWVAEKDISIMQTGDSVDRGWQDSGDVGDGTHGGYFPIGTFNPGGNGQVACSRTPRDGEQLRYLVANVNDYRWRMMTFHTHVCNGLGGADGIAGRTYAQVAADHELFCSMAHARLKRHAKIIDRTIQPYTTSTDGWATPVGSSGTNNQTAVSIGASGGIRDLANADKTTKKGTNVGCDYILNTNSVWQNQSTSPDYHTFWEGGKAFDSAHPKGAAQILAGAVLKTLIEAIDSAPIDMTASFSFVETADASAQHTQAMSAAFGFTENTVANHGNIVNMAASFEIGLTMTATPAYTQEMAAQFSFTEQAAGAGNYKQDMTAGFAFATTEDAAGTYTPPSGSFVPSDLPDYYVWLDSLTPGSMIEAGGAGTGLTTWNDKNGGSNGAATQAGASTLRPAIATWNGLTVVRFDGTSDFLNWALPTSFNNTEHTVVFVYRKTKLTAGNQYLMSGKITGGAVQGVGVGYDNVNHAFSAGVGGTAIQVNGGGDSNLHIIAYKYTTSPDKRVNGCMDGTAYTAAALAGAAYSPATYQLGRDTQTGGSYLQGDLLGVFVALDDLTNTEMNDLCNYFETYYNPTSGDAVWTDLP